MDASLFPESHHNGAASYINPTIKFKEYSESAYAIQGICQYSSEIVFHIQGLINQSNKDYKSFRYSSNFNDQECKELVARAEACLPKLYDDMYCLCQIACDATGYMEGLKSQAESLLKDDRIPSRDILKILKKANGYLREIYSNWKQVANISWKRGTTDCSEVSLLKDIDGSVIATAINNLKLINEAVEKRLIANAWVEVMNYVRELQKIDGRNQAMILYPLGEVFILALVAGFSFGYYNYQAVTAMEPMLDELRERFHLPFANGVPSVSRYCELLQMINESKVKSILERMGNRLLATGQARNHSACKEDWRKIPVESWPSFAQDIHYTFHNNELQVNFDGKGVHPENSTDPGSDGRMIPHRHIAFDGKTIRKASAMGGKYIHQVTAFSVKDGKSLDYVTVEGKGNELRGIEKLVENLPLRLGDEKIIATMDALSFTPEIIGLLCLHGYHFVVGLKENQKNLYATVENFFTGYFDYRYGTGKTVADEQKTLYDGVKCWNEFEPHEKHGRDAYWSYFHLNDASRILGDEFERFHNHITSITAVVRTVIDKEGKIKVTVSYYAGDIASEIQAGQLIRGHWSIEVMHNILDVSFGEDNCRVHKANNPLVLAAIRRFVMMQYLAFEDCRSINDCRTRFSKDRSFRDRILGCIFPAAA